MIKLIKCLDSDNENILKEYNLKSTKNVYFIEENGVVKGVIEFSIPYEFTVNIEYINIKNEYRRCGIAKKTIKYLRNKYSEYEFYGNSLLTKEAINFWLNSGAEFEEEFNIVDIEKNLHNECIPFIIY